MPVADYFRSKFIHIVTQIRREKGLEAIELRTDGGEQTSFHLCVDDTWFDIVHDDSEGSLTSDAVSIRAVICELPSTEEAEELFVDALRSNQHFARAAAGCLAVDPESEELIYMFGQSLTTVESCDFLRNLSEVASAVSQWRDQFVRLPH